MGDISFAITRRVADAQRQLHSDLLHFKSFEYRLKELAPKEVHELLEETNLISYIFAYGKWDGHFHDDEGEQYGYRNRRHLLSLLRQLKQAWKDVVEVKIKPWTGEVSVVFTAPE